MHAFKNAFLITYQQLFVHREKGKTNLEERKKERVGSCCYARTEIDGLIGRIDE